MGLRCVRGYFASERNTTALVEFNMFGDGRRDKTILSDIFPPFVLS